MARVISRAVVAFSAEGDGEGPLSWGQQDIWGAMTRYGYAMPLGGIKPLAPGTAVADVAAELRYLMSRYQVMRTRLRYQPDGGVRQVVSSRGQIVLEVIETDEDASAVAQEIFSGYQEKPFDYTKEWPVRMAVIGTGGIFSHMVVITHHLALDGFAALIMMTEVPALSQEPQTGLQPLEQARWQASPPGQRHNEAALKHWQTTLEAMPVPWPSRKSGTASTPRHWEGYFRSPAMHSAVRTIAQRTGVDPAPVLLTAYAIAISRIGGVNPVVIRPVVSNRFRPGLSNVVAPISQSGICLLDVAGVSFAEAVARTVKASMVAYKHSYFDPLRAQELVDKTLAARGLEYFVDSFVNDRRVSAFTETAAGHSDFTWTGAKDAPSARLYVQVEDAPDAVLLNIFADTHYVSQAQAEALLWEMESVMRSAV
jgi:hypothetical protein